jgi:hypothetical protein
MNFTKSPSCEEKRGHLLSRRNHLSFNGHEKPFPTWYPYAFIGAIAALGVAFYVFG